MKRNVIRLKVGRDASLKKGHPWLFSGAFDGIENCTTSGELADIVNSEGRFLARTILLPTISVWTRDESEQIDSKFFESRVDRAMKLRRRLFGDDEFNRPTKAMRLVSAEADGLPYLIVDRYPNRTLVVQFGPFSTVATRFKPTIVDALMKVSGCDRLLEREASNETRSETPNWIVGGSADDTRLEIVENGLHFNVDIATGHKTGFYLDQAENRGLFQQYVRQHRAKTVLDLCAYTGAFSVAALAGGATHVTSVELSSTASGQCVEHVRRNFGDAAVRDRHSVVTESAFDHLRKLNSAGTLYDAIVLDPPKFAQTKANVEKGAHALQDLNRRALRCLAPGGLLFTFNCSAPISRDLFYKVVASSATDIDDGMNANVLQWLGPSVDHSSTLTFPEGEYLRGFVVMRK